MTVRNSSRWAAQPDAESGRTDLEVLVPCYQRAESLAVTLSGLAAQLDAEFDVILSDQSEEPLWRDDAVAAMIRVLRAQGRTVMTSRNLPRRGMAQQRQHLLELSSARQVLYLDSDVWLEPGTISRMRAAFDRYGGGFMGSAVQGLSYLGDERPEEWVPFEPWDGPVTPEPAPVSGPAHERWMLHNAANLCHIAARSDATADSPIAYKIAWVGGCVLFDRARLIECGGFDFWRELPASHAGEDVRAQWNVMQSYGGSAVLPSGAVHLEAPTTIPDRTVEATDLMSETQHQRN